uniref:MC153R n=1 Tax=Rousettus bat poxvirus TaxID=3141933 RepID=A0AAU7E2B2_9POXV
MEFMSHLLIRALPFRALAQLLELEQHAAYARAPGGAPCREHRHALGGAASSLVPLPRSVDLDLVVSDRFCTHGWVSRTSHFAAFYAFRAGERLYRRVSPVFSRPAGGVVLMAVVCLRTGTPTNYMVLLSADGTQEVRLVLTERAVVIVNTAAVTAIVHGRDGLKLCVAYYLVDARRGANVALPRGVHVDTLAAVHEAVLSCNACLFQRPTGSQVCFCVARYRCVSGGDAAAPFFRVYVNGIAYALTVEDGAEAAPRPAIADTCACCTHEDAPAPGADAAPDEPVRAVAGCEFRGYTSARELVFSCRGHVLTLAPTTTAIPSTEMETFLVFPVPPVPLARMATVRELHIILRAAVDTLVDATSTCAGVDWAVSAVSVDGTPTYRLHEVRFLNGIVNVTGEN